VTVLANDHTLAISHAEDERNYLSAIPGEALPHIIPPAKKSSQILVKFKESAQDFSVLSLSQMAGSVTTSTNSYTGVHTMSLQSGVDIDGALNVFQASPLVEWAEPAQTLG